MVDYSKWDKLSVSSADDECASYDDDGNVPCSAAPQVTRFDQPSTVTFGGPLQAPQVTQCCDGKVEHQNTTRMSSENINACQSSLKADALDVEGGAKNGAIEDTFMWSQTKHDVTILFWTLPVGVKGKDVRVKIEQESLTTPPLRRNPCDILGKPSGCFLSIIINNVPFFNNVLCYPVLIEEDYVSWELKTFNEVVNPQCNEDCSTLPETPFRALLVELRKSDIIESTILWWNRLFIDSKIIDVNSIRDRQTKDAVRHKKAFQEVWKEAHARFIDAVKETKRTPISIDDLNEDPSEDVQGLLS